MDFGLLEILEVDIGKLNILKKAHYTDVPRHLSDVDTYIISPPTYDYIHYN